MLIYLNATTAQLAEADRNEIECLFSELLRASTIGQHIIVIDRTVCNWAKENLSCNRKEQAQLDRLRGLYAQRGSLTSKARSFLEVSIGALHLAESPSHKYQIGHKPFLKGKYLDTARFLVEHIENDGDFFTIILDKMRRSHPISAYKFERMHGGGTSIVSCLRVEIPNQRIVVSVVDSDKVAPQDRVSSTKRNLDNEAGQQTFIGMVCETPCKEVENFIPINILKEHKGKICPEFDSFEVLENLISRQNTTSRSDCIWLFYDLKKGIEAEKLDEISNPIVTQWLDDKYRLGGQSFCSSQPIGGFGDGILRQFLNCGEAVKAFTQFMDTEYWDMHFRDFFDLLYWYFASEKKARVS